jgi:hypothetical protein
LHRLLLGLTEDHSIRMDLADPAYNETGNNNNLTL